MIKVLNLYECPKCKQLRSEDTYSKNGVYYSTCKACRKNKGVEDHFANLSINKLAALNNVPYTSLNKNTLDTMGKSDRDRIVRKSATLNSHIFKLVQDYVDIPSSLDNNYRFINMLRRLASLDISDVAVDEIRPLLNEVFKYTITKQNLENIDYDVQVLKAGLTDILGQGHVVGALTNYNLKSEGVQSKKEMRQEFSDKKGSIYSELLLEKEFKCYICKKELKENKSTIDHVVPIALGGSNDVSNLEFCCSECNQLKSSKSEDEFNDFKLKLDAVGNLEQGLLNENEGLIDTLAYARKQIEYYTQMAKSMETKVSKNRTKITKYKGYREAVQNIISLEKSLGL